MGIVEGMLLDIFSVVRAHPIITVLLGIVFVLVLWIIKSLMPKGKNPFSVDSIRPRAPLVTDKEKRDAVLKQGFTSKKIPDNLDAIVIGSGIGGLSTAALLSKSGKKVLVLEQHDQAGGCCHTFIEKGFEFDVGIHYIGEVSGNTATHTLVNQICDGQIGWEPVDDVIDRLELGTGNDRTTHDICKGRENWRAELKKKFPSEKDHASIDQFFVDLNILRKAFPHSFILKMIPMWLVRFLIKSGIFDMVSSLNKYAKTSLRQYLNDLTDNKRLQAALSYSYGDYGTQPREAPVMMQLTLLQHYTQGGYYPIGGASEIAFNIIPVIERSGGKVLVRAPVEEILIDESGKAHGVTVKKGGDVVAVYAPIVISSAGYLNTFNSLIKNPNVKVPEIVSLFKKVKSGHGAISIFVGLDGTNEELGLKPINTWAMAKVDLDQGFDEFLRTPVEEVGKEDIPLLFISFPSTKDPSWNERFPGKSNCTIVTLAKWDWFEQWENERIMKRGDEYDDLKNRIAEKAWEQTCRFYPQIKDKRVYFSVGTPVTNKYYLGSPRGEIYGLNHDMARFDPLTCAQLRPTSPISGLYLTGQDVSTAGFAGGLYGGLLTTSAILNRNLMGDLITCMKETRRLAKKQKSE